MAAKNCRPPKNVIENVTQGLFAHWVMVAGNSLVRQQQSPFRRIPRLILRCLGKPLRVGDHQLSLRSVPLNQGKSDGGYGQQEQHE